MTIADDQTMAAPDESDTMVGDAFAAVNASNALNYAWSQASTQVRMVEPVDRQVLGQHHLSALAVKEPGVDVKWRVVSSFLGVSVIALGCVVVAAYDPVAVRNLVAPPAPEVTTTTATVTPAPLTATVTAPPITETTTAPPPVPGEQIFKQHMRDQGWEDAPDHELANGRDACSALAGPPRRTVVEVARADAAADHMSFPLVEAFIITAAVDLCPQYR